MIKISKLILILFFPVALFSQTEKIALSLSEAVALAQSDAPDALLAETRLSNRKWFYQSFLSDYKPQITLNGTLPEFNRTVERLALPDGITFFNRTDLFTSAGLTLSQNITKTGGRVFAMTELQRLDVFTGPSKGKQYFSTPIIIGFNQPIFGYNNLKWNKKIEPLRYEEASKSYAEEMENLAYQSVELFFNVFTEQLNVEATQLNKANADTLFDISKGRFSVGKIAETELLQIELSAMNADANLAQANLNLQNATERFRNFLGLKNSVEFNLQAPTDLPEFQIETEEALRYALMHRSDITSYQRRLLEAEANVAEAKANAGAQINVNGRVGLSKTAAQLSNAFSNPVDNERVSLNLSIPIADWGAGKAQLKVAQSNRELEQMTVEQERINLEREVRLNVRQFDLIRRQVTLSKRAYDVAIKREDITRKRYYIGKIGITDLNLAINDSETARRSYIQSLRTFWLAFYEIRRVTLFDFEKGKALVK